MRLVGDLPQDGSGRKKGWIIFLIIFKQAGQTFLRTFTTHCRFVVRAPAAVPSFAQGP